MPLANRFSTQSRSATLFRKKADVAKKPKRKTIASQLRNLYQIILLVVAFVKTDHFRDVDRKTSIHAAAFQVKLSARMNTVSCFPYQEKWPITTTDHIWRAKPGELSSKSVTSQSFFFIHRNPITCCAQTRCPACSCRKCCNESPAPTPKCQVRPLKPPCCCPPKNR